MKQKLTSIRDWRIGKVLQLDWERNKEGEKVYLSRRYHGTRHGYNQHDVKITVCKDGAIILSDGGDAEGFMYLYRDQVEHLRKILKDNKY